MAREMVFLSAPGSPRPAQALPLAWPPPGSSRCSPRLAPEPMEALTMGEEPGEAAGRGQWITITCVTVTCSRCGARPDGGDFAPHFDTAQQAREQLPRDYGWRITPLEGGGEELLCGYCAGKDDCDRLGHQAEDGGPYLILPGPLVGAHTWWGRCGEPVPPGSRPAAASPAAIGTPVMAGGTG